MAILDQLREGLHISVSQIRSYLRCGRLFELRYVLGAKPAFKPVPFAFGASFHAALAKFYVTTKETGTPPPLQLLADEFRSAWQREVDANVPLQADDDEPDDTGQLVDKGVQMLGVFHDHAARGLGGAKVEAVEAPFAVSLFDPDTGVEMEEKLVGAVDLVLKKGRKHQIIEHKTSSRRFGETEIRYDIQPARSSSRSRTGRCTPASCGSTGCSGPPSPAPASSKGTSTAAERLTAAGRS